MCEGESLTSSIAYSFVVDEGPTFAYQAWRLAHSLRLACAASPGDIHLQCTDAVSRRTRQEFEAAGHRVHALARFGDGRWCNKLAQLPNLLGEPFDVAVLLDTDMIALDELRPFVRSDRVVGKIVDFPNPSIGVLEEIYRLSGGSGSFETIRTDAEDVPTMLGNCNGGFYAVPRSLAEAFSAEWRRWASWLFENPEPLSRSGRLKNVDQISAALAFQRSGVPFALAPSNANYFIHLKAAHHFHDPSRPIALLHYHDRMTPAGVIEPRFDLTESEIAAIARANAQKTSFASPPGL